MIHTIVCLNQKNNEMSAQSRTEYLYQNLANKYKLKKIIKKHFLFVFLIIYLLSDNNRKKCHQKNNNNFVGNYFHQVYQSSENNYYLSHDVLDLVDILVLLKFYLNFLIKFNLTNMQYFCTFVDNQVNYQNYYHCPGIQYIEKIHIDASQP